MQHTFTAADEVHGAACSTKSPDYTCVLPESNTNNFGECTEHKLTKSQFGLASPSVPSKVVGAALQQVTVVTITPQEMQLTL